MGSIKVGSTAAGAGVGATVSLHIESKKRLRPMLSPLLIFKLVQDPNLWDGVTHNEGESPSPGKNYHRHLLRCVAMAILNPGTWTMKIN